MSVKAAHMLKIGDLGSKSGEESMKSGSMMRVSREA
jgi:hypothetical protein